HCRERMCPLANTGGRVGESVMSALGQKQTSAHVRVMSAIPPKADIARRGRKVRVVPKADIGAYQALLKGIKSLRYRVFSNDCGLIAAIGIRCIIKSRSRGRSCFSFTLEQRRSAMKVKEAMHKGVDWVSPDTPVTELAKLMRDHDVGAIPIGENDRLVGMVTDRDIVCKGLAQDNFDARDATARDVMTAQIHC